MVGELRRVERWVSLRNGGPDEVALHRHDSAGFVVPTGWAHRQVSLGRVEQRVPAGFGHPAARAVHDRQRAGDHRALVLALPPSPTATRPVLRGRTARVVGVVGVVRRTSTPPGRPGSRRAGLVEPRPRPVPRDRPGSPRWLSVLAVPRARRAGACVPRLPAVGRREDCPQKVFYNSWFATEFDVRADHQLELARRAARTGVETFVVDDGWFVGRSDDTGGLGDWEVDPAAFPRGLGRIHRRLKEIGLDFGLWVEPESVSPKSRAGGEASGVDPADAGARAAPDPQSVAARSEPGRRRGVDLGDARPAAVDVRHQRT